MAVGGACPGRVLAQLGSGVATSGFTLAGCLSVRPPFLRPHARYGQPYRTTLTRALRTPRTRARAR